MHSSPNTLSSTKKLKNNWRHISMDFWIHSAMNAAENGTVPLPFLLLGMGIALLLVLLLYPLIIRPVLRAAKEEKDRD